MSYTNFETAMVLAGSKSYYNPEIGYPEIPFTFEEYCSAIINEKNKFEQPEFDLATKKLVAVKLKEMATEHINEEESNQSKFYKLIVRICNFFFSNFGFNTQGEWALKFAAELEAQADTNEIEVATLVDTFNSDEWTAYLEEPQSNEVTKLFEKEAVDFGSKMKLLRALNLNASQKAQLTEELLKKPDWLAQTFDFVEGGLVEKAREFMHPLAEKFIEDRKAISDAYADLSWHPKLKQDGSFMDVSKFVNTYAGLSIKHLLETNRAGEIEEYIKSFNYCDSTLYNFE